MRGNINVWSEILRYFTISEGCETKEEIVAKRRTLLCVALVSPALTDIALDGLWRSMASLKPICRVINSCDAGHDTVIFHSGGYWILRKPLSGGQAGCALNYLSRVRDFYFRSTGAAELLLWPILASSLGLGTTASLLPSLRSLSLDLSDIKTIVSWIHRILPLISSTLQRISYVSTSIHLPGVESLQNILKSRSIELTRIMYRGYPSSDLLQRCLLFGSLESLSLEFDFEGQSFQRYTQSSATVVDIFRSLENLQYLKIDLRVFPLRRPTLLKNHLKPTAPVLRNLQIKGDANDLQWFLLDGPTSTTLHSLSVSVVRVEGLYWKKLCDRAVSTFPHIQHLFIEAVPNSNAPQLLLSDLSAFISLSTIKSFRLNAVPHCLTGVDIINLAEAWPGLRTLTIYNEHQVIFSGTVLVALSRLPNLCELALPLNLMDLRQPLRIDTPTANCPLRKLTVTQYSYAPSTWNGKIDLARNIWMLFPMLDKFSAGDAQTQTYLDELYKLVQVLQSAIAIQDHRRALCDRRKKLAMETGASHETDDRKGKGIGNSCSH